MLVNIKNSLKKNRRGFTIVELNIAFTMLAIVGAGLMSVVTVYIVTTTRTNYSLEMTNDSQNLLRTLAEELRYGAGVRQTNTIADANAPGGNWNTSDTNFVIITAVPALNTSNEYVIDTDTGSPYMNEYVYYRQDKLLYRRILAHPDAAGNKAKTSCPPASATSACPADSKLVDNLKTITFSLFDQDNNSTTNAVLARSVKIDLTLERDSFGNPLRFDNSIRTTLRNTF